MPWNPGPMPHSQSAQALPPPQEIASPTTSGTAPPPLMRGSMNERSWLCVVEAIRQCPHQGSVSVQADSLELQCPLNMNKSSKTKVFNWMMVNLSELLEAGFHEQACCLLLIFEPLTRARMFKALFDFNDLTPQYMNGLKAHQDPKVRERFEQAVVGCMEQVLLHLNDDPKTFQRARDCLRPYCSAHSLAHLALQKGDAPAFWRHCADCSDEDRKSLARQVPDGFWAGGEQADRPPSEQLLLWVCPNIQAGFDAGMSQGLLACEKWLNRSEGWGDAALRRALVHAAVAHALAEHALSAQAPSARPDGLAGLLRRVWVEGLTPSLLQAIPRVYREPLLSIAVKQAANAPTAQALNGLVDCYLAWCDEPDVAWEDLRCLRDCLRSAFQQLLASDSDRDEQFRSEVCAMRTRMYRGLPDQINAHLQNQGYEAAADGIEELYRVAGPIVAVEHFTTVVEGFIKALLHPVGLSFGLTSNGPQVLALPEGADEKLKTLTQEVNALMARITAARDQPGGEGEDTLRPQLDQALAQLTTLRRERPMQQRLALEYLLSLLARCGRVGEEHPLAAKVRQYLEGEAMRRSAGNEDATRRNHQYRVQAGLLEHTLEYWRPSHGPLWETRAWLDELRRLGEQGKPALGDDAPLRSPEFVQWLDAMRKGGAAGAAVLADALAVAMDGKDCDTGALSWLFEHVADRVDLVAVLNAMKGPIQAGNPPASGVDRFLRLAQALLDQGGDWLQRVGGRAQQWQPGWSVVFDFCRFVAAQAQPGSKTLDQWLVRFVSDITCTASEQETRFACVKAVWLKDLVNGVPCDPQLHACQMSAYEGKREFAIDRWEGKAFQQLLPLVEPQAIPPKLGMDVPRWLRHNLMKGVLRCDSALRAFQRTACLHTDPYQRPQAFYLADDWASAMVSAFGELLSQPDGASALVHGAEDIAAIWAGAARQFPDWLDEALNPEDARWVKSLIAIFEAGGIPENDKRERLRAEVARWREALLAPQAV